MLDKSLLRKWPSNSNKCRGKYGLHDKITEECKKWGLIHLNKTQYFQIGNEQEKPYLSIRDKN